MLCALLPGHIGVAVLLLPGDVHSTQLAEEDHWAFHDAEEDDLDMPQVVEAAMRDSVERAEDLREDLAQALDLRMMEAVVVDASRWDFVP